MKKSLWIQLAVALAVLVIALFYTQRAHAHSFTACGPYACQPDRMFEPHILADYEQTVDGHRQRMTLTDFACNGRGMEAVYVDGNPKHFMRGCWSNGPQNMIEIAWPNGNVAEIPYGELVSTPYGLQVGF